MSPSADNTARARAAWAAGYRVRPMQTADADRVGEVHVEVWRQAYVTLVPDEYLAGLDSGRAARRWRQALTDQRGPESIQLVGVHPDGDLVGLASAGPAREEDPPVPRELYVINLLAAVQGTGLADLMMLGSVGDTPAYLWVLEGNARARAFYARYGFAPDGADKPHPPTGLTEVRLVRDGQGREH